jgi:lipoteichoic acid synthase
LLPLTLRKVPLPLNLYLPQGHNHKNRLCPCPPFELDSNQNEITENMNDIKRFIAHAGGGIGGRRYTNSLEALNLNYKKGFRLFELDIIKTSDGIYIAAHDWKHWSKISGYKGPLPPTRKVFKQHKIYNIYTPIDIYDINKWFKSHPDTILVTDKVNEPLAFSKQFIDKSRLMMELFTLKALREGLKTNLKSAMPTWSLLSKLKGNKVQTLSNLNVKEVAASRRIIGKDFQTVIDLKQKGIKLFVFHVNFDKGKDEKHVVCNEMDFVYGLYADSWDFHKNNNCVSKL